MFTRGGNYEVHMLDKGKIKVFRCHTGILVVFETKLILMGLIGNFFYHLSTKNPYVPFQTPLKSFIVEAHREVSNLSEGKKVSTVI